jgi:hypothetical protein
MPTNRDDLEARIRASLPDLTIAELARIDVTLESIASLRRRELARHAATEQPIDLAIPGSIETGPALTIEHLERAADHLYLPTAEAV